MFNKHSFIPDKNICNNVKGWNNLVYPWTVMCFVNGLIWAKFWTNVRKITQTNLAKDCSGQHSVA